MLQNLPPGSGVILAPNHADETGFKVCLVLSRRCGRRFLFMMNREAFDEGFGTAGWWLQRLGAFSVERGGKSEGAKRYAIELVKRGQEVLVIFPEGEIFYLNDLVQPFKSGAVDIGMKAVVESQITQDDWTAFLIPFIQMGSWQPNYLDLDPSQERLAETVLKLEHEIYQTQRPRQLANRGVFLRVGEPIDLGCFVSAYFKDAQSVRHGVAEQLRDQIQALIND